MDLLMEGRDMLIERDYMKRDNNGADKSPPGVDRSQLNRLLKPVRRQRLYGAHIVVIAFMFGVVIGMAVVAASLPS